MRWREGSRAGAPERPRGRYVGAGHRARCSGSGRLWLLRDCVPEAAGFADAPDRTHRAARRTGRWRDAYQGRARAARLYGRIWVAFRWWPATCLDRRMRAGISVVRADREDDVAPGLRRVTDDLGSGRLELTFLRIQPDSSRFKNSTTPSICCIAALIHLLVTRLTLQIVKLKPGLGGTGAVDVRKIETWHALLRMTARNPTARHHYWRCPS